MELTKKHLELLSEIATVGIAPDGVPYFYGGAFAELRRAELIVFWPPCAPRPETMHGSGVSGRWFLTSAGAELIAGEDDDQAPLSVDVDGGRGVTYPQPWYTREIP
ncbi:MAG: hypothetical protein ACXVRJ_09650 [Gaiellaceae bacterium]